MVDFALDIHRELHGADAEPPAEAAQRRADVVGKLRELQAAVDPVIRCLSDPNVIRNFRQDRAFNAAYLREEHGLGPDDLDALYKYARFQYDCGNYGGAAELLQAYKPLCTSPERNLAVLWGKLAADTLMQAYDAAAEDLARLREAVENQPVGTSPLALLQQRTWLMHWALHVYWNHEGGKQQLVDLFLSPAYMAAIQANAPHLLRYLAAAVVVTRRRRQALKELVRVVQQEGYEYSDPITRFLECVFVRYDFDGAQATLKEAEAVLDNDYFLATSKAEFLENARLFVFETYCRIHRRIDIAMLAERLGMEQGAAEKWVANLVLTTRLDAKIDATAGTVVMGVPSASSLQAALVERAKELSVRTFALANAVVGAPAATTGAPGPGAAAGGAGGGSGSGGAPVAALEPTAAIAMSMMAAARG
jgi:translation initiation factor 3 subunit E